MAVSGTIGDLFVITIENDASVTTATTATIPRSLTVEYITYTCTALAGAATVQFQSSPDGTVFTDMFSGAVNAEINNVALVAQSTTQGAGTMMLVPTAGQSITVASGANGSLRVTIAGNGATYLCRFFCSASSPATLVTVEV